MSLPNTIMRLRRYWVPGINHMTVVEHISAVGDLETHAHILLDQEQGNAFRSHLRHDAKDFANDQRRETPVTVRRE